MKQTFESFKVDDRRRAAFAAACAVTEGAASTPLLLFGKTATGKTHLLRAIAERLAVRDDVLHIYAADLADRLVDALRRHDAGAFDAWLDRFEIVLVDDLWFPPGRVHTRDALLSRLERARARGARIVATAPAPVAGIAWAEIIEIG